MQVTCTICGEKKTVEPCNLKINNTTSETYKCADCNRKYHKINKKPDWSIYRKLRKLARRKK